MRSIVIVFAASVACAAATIAWSHECIEAGENASAWLLPARPPAPADKPWTCLPASADEPAQALRVPRTSETEES